ncbi:MAG: helix-turn-helix domain-containing protein [Burkholderiaceae bacterium]|jgi:hypothetical protein|nr:helix-turn-helix domain-containing protein [Burkholderiaceae bacterium]
MSATATLADRIRETIGMDNAYDVARKLAEQGAVITPQAIYRWLEGSDVKQENLAALARAYGVPEAWLRYGEGPKQQLSESQQAAAKLFEELPPEMAQQSLDFIEYQLHRSTSVIAGERLAHYMTWISRIRANLEEKKKR